MILFSSDRKRDSSQAGPRPLVDRRRLRKELAQVAIGALLAIGAVVASGAVMGTDGHCTYMQIR